MLTREEAIRGLKYIESVAYSWNLNGLTLGKPTEEIEDICAAAAHLLKAQERGVMTLGDLRDIGSVWELNTPPYLWMEINPSYRWTRGFWVAWREIFDMIDGLHPTYDADNYGKIWRCWTARPTDAQREATPWQ